MVGWYWMSSQDLGAGYHRSWRHGEILADDERFGCDHCWDERGGGHVRDQGTDAPHGAQAAGVDEGLPRDRADQRVVTRRGSGDEIGQHPLQALVIPPAQAGISKQVLSGPPGGQVRLNGPLEQRVLTPRGIGEPAVAVLWSDRRGPGCDADKPGGQPQARMATVPGRLASRARYRAMLVSGRSLPSMSSTAQGRGSRSTTPAAPVSLKYAADSSAMRVVSVTAWAGTTAATGDHFLLVRDVVTVLARRAQHRSDPSDIHSTGEPGCPGEPAVWMGWDVRHLPAPR